MLALVRDYVLTEMRGDTVFLVCIQRQRLSAVFAQETMLSAANRSVYNLVRWFCITAFVQAKMARRFFADSASSLDGAWFCTRFFFRLFARLKKRCCLGLSETTQRVQRSRLGNISVFLSPPPSCAIDELASRRAERLCGKRPTFFLAGNTDASGRHVNLMLHVERRHCHVIWAPRCVTIMIMAELSNVCA